MTVKADRRPSEFGHAIILANKVLDRPNGDPDDDLAVLSRQFLRMIEALEKAANVDFLSMASRERILALMPSRSEPGEANG